MFDINKYNYNQQEIISWFSEMYVYYAIDRNVMSVELYDMYTHIAKNVLDSPLEIDDLIFSILNEHNLLPKNKVEQQQNIIDNLEKEIEQLKTNQVIQNKQVEEMIEVTSKLLEQSNVK